MPSHRRTDPLIAAALAAGAAVQAFVWPAAALAAVLTVVAALLAVRLLRAGGAARRERERLTAELERERQRTALLPAAEERAQIVRELRDIVAGGLDDIAAGAPEPHRGTAREALGELHRLLDVLGEDEDPAEPGLAQLPILVERARAAGMPVTLLVEGTPRRVRASLDRSAYRIVQEALVNAHRHAAGEPASVRVVWRRDLLGLQVRNTGANANGRRGDGHGLIRMRERVQAHGGELRAGALPSGGFEVTARLPL